MDSGSDANSIVAGDELQNVSSAEMNSSEESDEISDAATSDSDVMEEKKKRNSRKKKPVNEISHIPGERKSGRSNRGQVIKGKRTKICIS